MSHIDKQYRYDLGMNIPKFLGFFETLTHLDHVDPHLTPIDAAAHFLNFWRQKHQKIQNNILHRKLADAFEEQVKLARNRFLKIQAGQKLTLSDFEGTKITFFEKNHPQFPKAIYLMETFYEDPPMFFGEDIESDQEIEYLDYSDDESELVDLEISPDKTGYSQYIAVESLYEEFSCLNFTDEPFTFFEEIRNDFRTIDVPDTKWTLSYLFRNVTEISENVDLESFNERDCNNLTCNDPTCFENFPEPDQKIENFDLRSKINDFGNTPKIWVKSEYNDIKPLYPGLHKLESLTFEKSSKKSDFHFKWNFFDFHTKNGNSYFKNFDKRFCSKQPSMNLKFARLIHLMSRVNISKSLIFGGRGHRFLMTLESKISKFKFFTYFSRLCLNLSKSNLNFRLLHSCLLEKEDADFFSVYFWAK